MKTFLYKRREVKLITKRSDGNCLVMRQTKNETTGHIMTRRFWTPIDTLSKPKPKKASAKTQTKPGVKKAQPEIKTVTKIQKGTA